MLYRHQMISLMLLLVAMLSGCASEKAETEAPVPPVVIDEPTEPEPISLLFACAPANTNQAMTRLAENVVQSGTDYRTITKFRFFGQTKDGSSVCLSDCIVLNPVNLLDYIETPVETPLDYRYYHADKFFMVEGVNACLVYAKADAAIPPTGVPVKVYNGSLVPDFPTSFISTTSTNDIRFSLESILDATEARQVGGEIHESDLAEWEKEAWTLANTLTAVVNDSHNEDLDWKTSTNSILRNLFQRFTNNGADLPGSAASVKQWMLDLARTANYYRTTELSAIVSALGVNEKTLLETIETVATNAAAAIPVTAMSYPRDINLPDGAAALRWVEVEENSMKVNKFVPQMQTTTLDDINSVSRFVYPPELYYFVDSPIKTSPEKMNYKTYNDDHGTTTWNAFLSLEDFSDTEVKSNTKTVIVADPLQYAVAHLTMEVKAEAASLEYGAGNENKIDISKLTLKGVIIGGQRPVDYQFKPIDNSEFNVNFVYDSQVSSSTPLNTTGDTYHTLALQSYDGENINVILEFEYSDAEGTEGFKCLNGYVYPGTRFYLVGEVKLDANALNETDDYKKRVFTQDYTTTIEMTVQSLEKAYNVLPSLLSNSLEIGVMITPKWFSATPSEPVVME